MKHLFFFLVLTANLLYSQNINLTGQIADSTTKEFLGSANVILHNQLTYKTIGTAADLKGKFLFYNLKTGKYKLEISFIGYSSYQKEITLSDRSLDLGIIYLKQSGIQTGEVQVIDKLIPAIQKEDTTEYNAEAFKTNKDATAEELVNKIPGVTNQDGKIQVQGEDVKNVLVDGRVFFGNDPSAVLRNLPAEVVEKIQVFDKQSEQSEFTGFDDGNTSKTLNVVTRFRTREGTFGKATAGYGNESKYLTGGSLNFFRGSQRISLLGQLNNINEQNFSNEDLVGVTSGGGGGMRGGGFRRMGREGGGDQGSGFRGDEASDFLVNSKDGITRTGALGINYADEWTENLELTGSYFYNSSDNNSAASLRRDYFVASGIDQLYSEDYSSESISRNHRANLRIDYKIDSLNSFLFTPRISLQDNLGDIVNKGNTVAGSNPLNVINNFSESDQMAINASGTLLYRKKFIERGRTLSLNISSSYKRNKGDNSLYSENTYYNENFYSDTLDQIYRTNRNGTTSSANLVYTEPLNEISQLMFNGGLTYTAEYSDQKTLLQELNSRNPRYIQIDSLLSSTYDKEYQVINLGTGYRYQDRGISLITNLSFNKSLLEKKQTFPSTIVNSKHFYSVLPSFMLRYSINRDNNLRIHYRTANREPSVEQLQFVLNNSNPQQLTIGNPDLVQDYRHSLNLRYSKINASTLHSMFVLLSGTFAQDYIGYNTLIAGKDTLVYKQIVINPGVQLRVPANLDGYFNVRSMLTYGLPVIFLKSNLNVNLSTSFSNTPAVINGTTNKAKSSSIGLGFVLGSSFSRDLDFTISTNSSYNFINNTVQKNNNNEFFNQRSKLKLFAVIWKGFFTQTEFTHQYDGGLSEDYDPNSYLLNFSMGKKLFSKDQGEIRFTAYDVFNKSSNIKRTVTDTYWEDTSTNVIGSYFILSFTYNLRAF